MLVPVILSGGAGTRLWPVSRSAYPKPFMRMGDGESLLRKTLDRALRVADGGHALTVTGRDYYFLTRDEYANHPAANLDKLPFLLEPAGRNTAPAVLLGLYTNKLNPWALLLGWIAGMASGTWMAWVNAFKVSIYPLHILGVIVPCYAAVSSLAINLGVSIAFSWLFNAVLRTPPSDATEEADYA